MRPSPGSVKMSVALLLWFCLSLLSGSGDADPTDSQCPDFSVEVVSSDKVNLLIVPSTADCPATSFIVSGKGESSWDHTFEEVAQFTTTNTNLTLTGLHPGTYYSFQVSIQNGAEIVSVTKNATTFDAQPTVVQNVQAFRVSNETVRVKWSPPQNSYGTIKNYWIEIYNFRTFPVTSTLFKASSDANQLTVHIFTSDNFSLGMSASVWVENQTFNGTKSPNAPILYVPQIFKFPFLR